MEQRLSGQVRDVGDRVDAADAASAVRDSALEAKLDSALEMLAAHEGRAGAPPTAESTQSKTDAIERIVEAGGEAARLITEGKIDEGVAALRTRIATEDRARTAQRATEWSDIGAILYSINALRAAEAYEEAAKLQPEDVWTHIFLVRLYQAVGRTPQAEAAARTALRVAVEPRDYTVALASFGDVLRTRSDLTGALQAYEEGLGIARKLAADDPTNAERLRDVSVSLDRIGDVLSTRSDLTGALQAYEEGLGIRRKLAADDPTNAERQIDLGISLAKQGQMAEARGETELACRLFTEARDLFGRLSARAPDHSRLRDMAEMATNDTARVCGA